MATLFLLVIILQLTWLGTLPLLLLFCFLLLHRLILGLDLPTVLPVLKIIVQNLHEHLIVLPLNTL